MIRAFVGNLANPGRPAGGSTITQQVAKNLLVGDDVTYDRKMREMIVASRIERVLTKAEILEIYLNSIYLGRSSWGIEMAARSYFGKSAKSLSVAEGALLAGLAKGPNYYNPDHQAGARPGAHGLCAEPHAGGRFLKPDQMQQAVASLPERVPLRTPAAHHGLPLRRPCQPRCAHARRYREPDRRRLYGAHHHQPGPAAGDRGCLAGGARALRAERRPPALSGRARPTSPRPSRRFRKRSPMQRMRLQFQPGGRLWRRCGCLSTTCSGRRPS